MAVKLTQPHSFGASTDSQHRCDSHMEEKINYTGAYVNNVFLFISYFTPLHLPSLFFWNRFWKSKPLTGFLIPLSFSTRLFFKYNFFYYRDRLYRTWGMCLKQSWRYRKFLLYSQMGISFVEPNLIRNDKLLKTIFHRTKSSNEYMHYLDDFIIWQWLVQ